MDVFFCDASVSVTSQITYEICMIDVCARLRFSGRRARPHISHGRAPRARPLTPRRARPRARGNRHARARRFVSPQFVC